LINSSAQINFECKCDDAAIQKPTCEENRIKMDQRHCAKKKDSTKSFDFRIKKNNPFIQ